MAPHRYLVVQVETSFEILNFCEIEVYVRRKSIFASSGLRLHSHLSLSCMSKTKRRNEKAQWFTNRWFVAGITIVIIKLRARCLLVSNAWLLFWRHSLLSSAFSPRMCRSLFNRASMSFLSVHLFHGLPVLFDTHYSKDYIMTKKIQLLFHNLLHYVPCHVPIQIITSFFLIFCCHRVFIIRLKYFIWNVCSLSLSFWFSVRPSPLTHICHSQLVFDTGTVVPSDL